MATAAQIEANRRNAQSSTGPKTDEGKSSARGNALKHGMAALTIMPGLPQEDPKQFEERIQEWDSDVQPQNAVERDLVRQAARLSLAIERGERIETAHMARRVRMAGRMRTQKLSTRRRKQVRELGRRLLYVAGPEEVKVDKQPLWADDPGLLVSELEESAEGCRWLLERWAEYRNLLDRRSKWEEPVLIRFIRLQGKQVVESVYDPALNSIFLAWDVLVQKYAKEEWESFREERPTTDPAYNHRLHWREIAPRPSDPAGAWEVLYAIVDQHVGRLKELLAENLDIEAAADPDWADRAALDCSPAFERHRRYQSAKTRELLRTLDTLRKMRNAEFGMRNGKAGMAEGGCRAADDEWQMADDEWQMADDEWQVAGGEPKSPIQNPQSKIQERRRKKRRTKPNWNRRKTLLHKELNHKMPSRRSANEANPRRVGRLSRARATIGLKRLCRRARVAGRLGAAKVVRYQKQRPVASEAEGREITPHAHKRTECGT